MGAKYLCNSWQGLVQMLVYLCGRGYYFYHITYLPQKKRAKWPLIDQKLIQKYDTDKSKWQRYRIKEKGLVCFVYLRWENVAVIMHSLGELPDGITCDDAFRDVRKRPMVVRISELVSFEIYSNEKPNEKGYSVKLTSETYQGIKRVLGDTARQKDVRRMKLEFEKLNGFPAWAGIIEQKRQLEKYLRRQAKKHQVRELGHLRIVTKRKPVKVWSD